MTLSIFTKSGKVILKNVIQVHTNHLYLLNELTPYDCVRLIHVSYLVGEVYNKMIKCWKQDTLDHNHRKEAHFNLIIGA